VADRQLNYRITVDQSAGTSGIRDFSRQVTSELRKVDRSLADTETAAQRAARVLGQMADQAETELQQAARAADALAAALGPEMAAKLGRNGIAEQIGQLNRMGLTFEDIEADADSLAASMRRLDEVQTSAVNQGLGNLSGKLNDTEGAARGANSALANMIGNTAQDVSGLSGNLGSLGVAIGQMGEYAADAALDGAGLVASLKSMAAVAGPIAALGLATQLVNSQLPEMALAQAVTRAFHTDQIKDFTDALREGGDAADNYADHLRDVGRVMASTGQAAGPAWSRIIPGVGQITGALGVLGRYGETIEDISHKLEQAGLTADQWAQIVTSAHPVDAMNTFRDALDRTNLSFDERSDLLVAAKAAQDDYTQATANAEQMNRVFGTSADDAADSVSNQAYETAKLAANTDRAQRAARDFNQAWDDLTGALDSDRAILNLADDFDEMKRRGGEAWDAAVNGADDADQKMRDYQQSILTAKDDVVRLGQQLGLSIPEVKKMLLQIDDVERRLDIMARNRTMNLSIIANGGQGYPSASGGSDFGPRSVRRAPAPAGPSSRRAAPAGADVEVATAAAPAAAVPEIVFPVAVVPSSTPAAVTLDLRGAVVGNRFELARTVRDGIRDGIRLAGSRP
jgi:hypothetical protein